MEQVAGAPLLRVMLQRALIAETGPVLCTLPGPDHPRMACLVGLDVYSVMVPDADEGMGASLRAGVSALPKGCAAVMILPADLPDLDADDLVTMWNAYQANPAAILRAQDQNGQAGHPVIFPVDLFPDLAACHGDSGARDILQSNAARIVMVTLPATHATTDLDTPEEWAAWRAAKT